MGNYLSISDGDHFVSCLRLVDSYMKKRHKDETDIRWIVLGLYDALYAILIENLTRTDGFGIFNGNFERRVRDFYSSEKDSASPEFIRLGEDSLKENVASVRELLKRANLPSGARIIDENIEKEASPSLGLCRLKAMRDAHAHPRPMTHAIDMGFLIDSFDDTLSVIQEIRELPSKRRYRHHEEEAELLLTSINFYLQRWNDDCREQSDEIFY